jgi:hypothetical protein
MAGSLVTCAVFATIPGAAVRKATNTWFLTDGSAMSQG